MLPIVALMIVALEPQLALWQHLSLYVLPFAVRDSALLMLGVCAGAAALGTALASLVSFADFPGRRFIAAVAILPLAFPIYLHAFVYVELLDVSGPAQTLWRAWSGSPAGLPEIRSIWGAVAIFSLVLYPYVYLPLLLAFSAQSRDLRDVARTLGCTTLRAFLRVQLPAARPAFVSGLMLALMEAMADFGASEYLGVRTFAYTIYSTWTTRGSLSGAAQIAILLLGLVAALTVTESYSRRASAYYTQTGRVSPVSRVRLAGFEAFAASIFCFLTVAFAFAIPAGYLVYSAILPSSIARLAPEFGSLLLSSMLLASVSASLIAVFALALSLLQRWERPSPLWHATNVCSLGYAIPGVVLALGTLFAYGAIDNAVDAAFRGWFGVSTGLLISGTPAILVLAYLSRFTAVAHGPIHSRLLQVPKNHDHVARTLGRSPQSVAREVLIPQVRATLAAAWLLLVVDVMKELPITLLVRPIGIETLATSLYGHAARGQFEDGSYEALAILICGVVAVVMMQRMIMQRRELKMREATLSGG